MHFCKKKLELVVYVLFRPAPWIFTFAPPRPAEKKGAPHIPDILAKPPMVNNAPTAGVMWTCQTMLCLIKLHCTSGCIETWRKLSKGQNL